MYSFEEELLTFTPTLAQKIGLNEAIFLQHLYEVIYTHKMRGWAHIDERGDAWVRRSQAEWLEYFPFWAPRTLQRIITHLKEMGAIYTTTHFNAEISDHTNWYRLDDSTCMELIQDTDHQYVPNEGVRAVY